MLLDSAEAVREAGHEKDKFNIKYLDALDSTLESK
jgi:hypothetical protein